MKTSVMSYFARPNTLNVLTAFGAKLAVGLLTVITSAQFARNLTESDMGIYLLASNFANFLSIIGQAGMCQVMLHLMSASYAVGDPHRTRRIVSYGFAIVGASCIVASAGLLLGKANGLGNFYPPGCVPLIGWICVWFTAIAFQTAIADACRALNSIPMASLCGGVLSLSALAAAVSYVRWKHEISLDTILLLTVTTLAASVLVGACWIAVKVASTGVGAAERNVNVNPEQITLLGIWSSGIPVVLSNIMAFVITQSDIWILAAYCSETTVAVYGIAARIVLLTGFALSVANAVLPPLIAKMNVENRWTELEAILRRVATLISIPSCLMLLLLICFGGLILETVFGAPYRQGALVLGVLCIGQIFSVCTGSCGYLLLMSGHYRAVMYINVLTALVAIVFGVIGAIVAKETGVAIAFSAAMVVQQLTTLFVARRLTGIWTHVDVTSLPALWKGLA